MSDLRLYGHDALWEPVFKAVAGRFTTLEAVCLRGYFGTYDMLLGLILWRENETERGPGEDDFTKSVQRYVLEGGIDMPDSYQELKRDLGRG